MIEFLTERLSHDWLVMLLSSLPVSELRGGIPLGIMLGMPAARVFFLAVIGNLIPVLPLLYLLQPVSTRLRRFGFWSGFFDWLFERTRRKSSLIIRYEILGLVLFVAMPLPMTGAWTGCVAASLLGLDKKKSFLAVACGVLIAAIIVTLLTLGTRGYFQNV